VTRKFNAFLMGNRAAWGWRGWWRSPRHY